MLLCRSMKNMLPKKQAANWLILILVALVLVLSVARGHVVASLVGHGCPAAPGSAASALP